MRPVISNSFHGRDIFAPMAGHLAAGVPVRVRGPDDSGGRAHPAHGADTRRGRRRPRGGYRLVHVLTLSATWTIAGDGGRPGERHRPAHPRAGAGPRVRRPRRRFGRHGTHDLGAGRSAACRGRRVAAHGRLGGPSLVGRQPGRRRQAPGSRRRGGPGPHPPGLSRGAGRPDTEGAETRPTWRPRRVAGPNQPRAARRGRGPDLPLPASKRAGAPGPLADRRGGRGPPRGRAVRLRQEHAHPGINGLIPHAYPGDLGGEVRIEAAPTPSCGCATWRRRRHGPAGPGRQIVGATVEAELAFGPENLAVPREIRDRIREVVERPASRSCRAARRPSCPAASGSSSRWPGS